MMSLSIKEIHEQTRKRIEAGEPGYAQATVSGQLVSWHRGVFSEDTFTGVVPEGKDVRWVRAMFLDLWVKSKAIVSPKTFSKAQLLFRASQWEAGNGEGIDQGQKDKEFATAIRNFAMSHT